MATLQISDDLKSMNIELVIKLGDRYNLMSFNRTDRKQDVVKKLKMFAEQIENDKEINPTKY